MGKHFYTTDANEATRAIQSGKVLEGIACCVLPVTSDPQPPVVPLLRLYKGSIDDHFYTTDQAEADRAVQQDGYTFELVACDAFDPNQPPAGTVPLFRVFNPQSGEHFYTADPNELSNVTQNGFQQEPSPCFVYDLNQTSVPQGTLPFYRMFTP
jgi:hypothetical protein